ncbi:MAG TPA: hypothetical protein VN414_13270 [Methanosarcina sp.]|nr:hypothetical protein [Methanosarcina sp.]
MSKTESVKEENVILLAIRKHCLHCMGGDKELVDNCPADWNSGVSACTLWGYRNGPLTHAKRYKKRLLSVISANCRNCLGKAKEVRECTCDGRGGYRKCTLYDYRLGTKGGI